MPRNITDISKHLLYILLVGSAIWDENIFKIGVHELLVVFYSYKFGRFRYAADIANQILYSILTLNFRAPRNINSKTKN